MYYVIGENKSGEFEAWEYLTASQAMAIRNDYLTQGLNSRLGTMGDNK